MTNTTDPMRDISSVSADLVEVPLRQTKILVYAICSTLCLALTWSYFAETLEVATGIGAVVPEQHVQVIQSLEGGAIQKIVAHNGDHVTAGDVLVELDPTPSNASRDEVSVQLAGLEVARLRLRALLDNSELHFPDAISKQHPLLVQQNIRQFESSKAELAGSLSVLEYQISQREIDLSEAQKKLADLTRPLQIATREYGTFKKLHQQGAASTFEVSNAEGRYIDVKSQAAQIRLSLTKLKAAISELESQRSQMKSSFQNRNGEILVETEVKISALEASLKSQQKRLDQTSIRAPRSGIVKLINATSLGQVIGAGDKVAEIVPEGGALLVQAKVRPDDIAFLQLGMTTLVKLTAYDYSIFGSLTGKLKRIAADSTIDDHGQTFYMVDVELLQSSIKRHGIDWPIKSGMVANIEIVTGKRSILQYITKPIHRMAMMSMRER